MKAKVLTRNIYLTLSYIIISLFLIYVTDRLILTADFYEKSNKSFGDSPEQSVYAFEHLYRWVYPLTVVYILIKFLSVGSILQIGFFLSGKKVSYLSVLEAVVCADFLFLIPAAIKIYWFLHQHAGGDLRDWIHFYPGSLLTLLNYQGTLWLYPLQTLNIFEVIYWFLLAFFLSRILKTAFDESLKLVMTAYLPALIMWSVVMMFYATMINPSG